MCRIGVRQAGHVISGGFWSGLVTSGNDHAAAVWILQSVGCVRASLPNRFQRQPEVAARLPKMARV